MDAPERWMETVETVWLMAMGLALGSFLNVVIARLPEGLSVVHPPSRCPRCGHRIRWYENIPVLSWIFLRAKCSSCRLPISPRYPLIELLTVGLVYASLLRFGWSWALLSAVVLVLLLVPLTFIDLDHWVLPHELTWPGIILGVLTAVPLGWERVGAAAIGTVAGFLIFWALEVVGAAILKKEALGGGDKFLVAMLGGFLTYRGLFGVILFSSLQGSVLGITLKLMTGKAGFHALPSEAPRDGHPARAPDEEDWQPGASNLPFGPYLAAAALEVLFFGPWLRAHLPWPLGEYLGGP